MKLTTKAAIAGALFATVSVAACAKGSKTPQFLGTEEVAPKEPEEPEPTDSVKVPPPAPEDDDAGTDSGAEPETPGGDGEDAGAACTNIPPGQPCALSPQCGCGEGEMCTVTNASTGAVACIEAGEGKRGSACTTNEDCAKGLACAYGVCRPYCAKENEACSGDGLGTCSKLPDPTGTAVPNAFVCTIACNPREPSAACGTNTCVWDTTLKVLDCNTPGTGDLRSPCQKYDDCKPGLGCVAKPLGNGAECQRWCRVGKVGDCDQFETCIDVYGPGGPKVGADKLGHCR